MHICVIGAGVIGVTTAYLFARNHYRVTLIDALPQPSQLTSYANGGQLSYSYVAPLAGPGVIASLPGWLLDKGSPVRFSARMDRHLWRWLLSFMRACNAADAAKTTADMLQLSFLSRDTLHAWMQESSIDFDYSKTGKLIVYRDVNALEAARKQVEQQAALGSQQRIVLRDELLNLEPTLRGIGHLLAGAVYTADEESGDCRKFTQVLFEQLQSMSNVTCLMGQPVHALQLQHGRIVGAQTRTGQLEADAFVVANGIACRELLQPLGYAAPVYGLKGYSYSIPIEAENQSMCPTISVTDYQRRIVYARLGDTLRVAAMVDIGDETTALHAGRLAALKMQIQDTFPSLNMAQATPWAGLRPATPHSKPIIGALPHVSNLWLNIGHGALGFTLACGSAVLLKALLEKSSTPIDASPFSPVLA